MWNAINVILESLVCLIKSKWLAIFKNYLTRKFWEFVWTFWVNTPNDMCNICLIKQSQPKCQEESYLQNLCKGDSFRTVNQASCYFLNYCLIIIIFWLRRMLGCVHNKYQMQVKKLNSIVNPQSYSF